MSAPSTSGPPLLRRASAAAAPLGVSKQYVRSLIVSGRLRAIRLRTHVRIPQDELEGFVAHPEDTPG